MITIDEIAELEKVAELNDGHCDRCHQTIKIYGYNIGRSHAVFLRAMAQKVAETGVNNVDISTIGLAYSVRSQVTKLRFHGLIARIKNNEGAQVARHWLITHKGYDFLNGNKIDEKVLVYNNQVLGHAGRQVNIYTILGEPFDPNEPLYEELPVTPAEAKVYDDVRTPNSHMIVEAIYKSKHYADYFIKDMKYKLRINRLQMGKPVTITAIEYSDPDKHMGRVYPDIASFQKDWKVL